MQYFTDSEIQEIERTINEGRYLTFNEISNELENEMDLYVSNGVNYFSNNNRYMKLLIVESMFYEEIYDASRLINDNLHNEFEVKKITNDIYDKYKLNGIISLNYFLQNCSSHKSKYIKQYIDIPMPWKMA